MIQNVSIRDVEREIARLRQEIAGSEGHPALRTSSMTHLAWVPEAWEQIARETLAGLAERHPSRGILLLPRPDDPRDELDAEIDVRCFRADGVGRDVCAEVIALRLNGPRANAPASVVLPLLISDLPVFLRWRGELPFGMQPFEELVGVTDRLIVDSREWEDPGRDLARLADLAGRLTVSDIAWTRTRAWREAIAELWPEVARASTLRVQGPEADALLLARWLGTRLRRPIKLEREPAEEVEAVEVDGLPASPRKPVLRSRSDLLSEHLDRFERDAIYEEALWSFLPAPT